MTLGGGPFAAIAAMLPSFEIYPPPFTNENHYVTCDTMLARDVRGNWLAKAFMVMTTGRGMHLLRIRSPATVACLLRVIVVAIYGMGSTWTQNCHGMEAWRSLKHRRTAASGCAAN